MTRRGGCFCTCVSCSFACAGALKFVLFALGAKRPPKQIHCKKHDVLMIFQCSRFCRGRREEGTRGSKREPKQHTKNTTKTTKPLFFQGPGPSLQKSTQKPRKRHPREATMTPRSGPGGAGSDPRGPKTTPRAPQERPKSRPEAVSEQPWWPPGADLAPKRLPEPSGEPFWPPRGWILAPVQPSSSHRDKPSSFPKIRVGSAA